VKDILRRACDRIDAANGQYDPSTGHSPLYGFGRVNAATAVKLASATPRATKRGASGSPRRKQTGRKRNA